MSYKGRDSDRLLKLALKEAGLDVPLCGIRFYDEMVWQNLFERACRSSPELRASTRKRKFGWSDREAKICNRIVSQRPYLDVDSDFTHTPEFEIARRTKDKAYFINLGEDLKRRPWFNDIENMTLMLWECGATLSNGKTLPPLKSLPDEIAAEVLSRLLKPLQVTGEMYKKMRQRLHLFKDQEGERLLKILSGQATYPVPDKRPAFRNNCGKDGKAQADKKTLQAPRRNSRIVAGSAARV